MEGQGRGAEVRAAWGTNADPAAEGPGRAARPGALQLADARLDGPRLGLRRIDSRTDSASEGDRPQA